jgi:Zn-dependent alcohol dehydrogenase
MLVHENAVGTIRDDIPFAPAALIGCGVPHRQPKYVDMYLSGRLELDEMVSAQISLDQINDGFESMKAGEVARSVIVFN